MLPKRPQGFIPYGKNTVWEGQLEYQRSRGWYIFRGASSRKELGKCRMVSPMKNVEKMMEVATCPTKRVAATSLSITRSYGSLAGVSPRSTSTLLSSFMSSSPWLHWLPQAIPF